MYSKKIIVFIAICFGGAAFLLGRFIQPTHQSKGNLIFYDSISEIENSIAERSGASPFEKQELKTNDAHYLMYSTDPVRGTAFYCIYCFEQADPHDQSASEKQRWLLRGIFSINALTYTNGGYRFAKPQYEINDSSISVSVAGHAMYDINSYAVWSKAIVALGQTNAP
ncbi:MAG: hypothetical protein ABSF10_20385 [Verrucomicrobiota bacterium]|jgi:hypothetical protein